jgi:hypothetical protein
MPFNVHYVGICISGGLGNRLCFVFDLSHPAFGVGKVKCISPFEYESLFSTRNSQLTPAALCPPAVIFFCDN